MKGLILSLWGRNQRWCDTFWQIQFARMLPSTSTLGLNLRGSTKTGVVWDTIRCDYDGVQYDTTWCDATMRRLDIRLDIRYDQCGTIQYKTMRCDGIRWDTALHHNVNNHTNKEHTHTGCKKVLKFTFRDQTAQILIRIWKKDSFKYHKTI